MIALVQNIRRRFPILWRAIETLNGVLVRITLARRLVACASAVTESGKAAGFAFALATIQDLDPCHGFLAAMDSDDTKFFRPFPFSRPSLKKIITGGGYQLFLAREGSVVLGVFFLRLFFDGRAFLGFSVARTARGKGLGTAMVRALAAGAIAGRLDLFSTVSEYNQPSYKAHMAAASFKVSESLPDNYLVLHLEGGLR